MRFIGFLIITLGFPALELAGIYQIWQLIGAWTLLWLLAAMAAGASILRMEQVDFMPRLMYSAFEGQTPLSALWEGGRRIIAGILLILPGAISDVIALVLLLWPSPPRPRGPRAANDDYIEGEYRRID